jgi:hypothetical protein
MIRGLGLLFYMLVALSCVRCRVTFTILQRDTTFSIFSYQINVFTNASRVEPGQGVCGKRRDQTSNCFLSQQIYKPFADQHSSTEADASAAVVRTGEPKALDHKVELSQHHLQALRKAAHHLLASPREYLRCQTRRPSLKLFQWMSQRPALAVIRFPVITSLALSLSG